MKKYKICYIILFILLFILIFTKGIRTGIYISSSSSSYRIDGYVRHTVLLHYNLLFMIYIFLALLSITFSKSNKTKYKIPIFITIIILLLLFVPVKIIYQVGGFSGYSEEYYNIMNKLVLITDSRVK